VRKCRWHVFLCLLLFDCVINPQLLFSQSVPAALTSSRVNVSNLPFAFEPSVGRAAEPNTYTARSGSIRMRFSPAGFQIMPTSPDGSFLLNAEIAGANRNTRLVTDEKTGGESNYLLGNDSSTWKTHVPQFGRLRYQNVYPGVDLVFYGNNGRLEHDFVVQPGANYRAIKIRYEGQRSLHLTPEGDLAIAVGSGLLSVRAPRVYQEQDGQKIVRAGRFVVNGDVVSFSVQQFDHALPLIIDPVLDYATYLANQDLHVNGVAVDASGNTYIVGLSFYATYPVTTGAVQTTCTACASNEPDVFITKLNATGTAQVYSTFLGGSNYNEGDGITVDSNGNAIVVGRTSSSDFPLKNPLPAGSATYNAFVASIAPDGASLNFSSILGGGAASSNTYVVAVATDTAGNAYVSGSTDSPLIPQTTGALNGGTPSYGNGYYFLTKLSPSGSLTYGAILGAVGSASECCTVAGIRVDAQNNVYLGGTVGVGSNTSTTPWPTTPGAYQSQPLSALSASPFAAKVSPDGSQLLYSTLVGTGVVSSMALNAAQEIILVGTPATGMPITSDAFDSLASQSFIAKLSADATQLVYSSYFGKSQAGQGVGDIYSTNVSLDGTGNVWLAGTDGSGTNLPVVNPLQSLPGSSAPQSGMAFVSEFDPALHNLLFSTYFGGNQSGTRPGGLALDGQSRVHFVGTGMDDLPTTASAFLGSVTPPPAGYIYQFGFAALIDPTATGAGICFPGDSFFTGTLGSSTQETIKVTDCGDAPLIISNIQISGAGFSLPSPTTCAVTIAPGGSCSFPLTFDPTVANNSYGTLTFSSNATVAQTILPITGDAMLSTGPAVTLSSESQDFGSVPIGSTSSQRMVTVMNVGNAPLTVTSVTTSGEFAQTNNCNTSVLQNEDCTIVLTFSPTAGGTQTGSLTITSNATGSPQTVSLTGVGVAAFTVAPSSPTLTVSTVGQSTSTSIQLSSQTGFTGTVSLTCSVQFAGQGSATDPPTCSISPAQVQVSGTGSGNSTLTVITSTSSSAAARASIFSLAGAVLLLGFAPRRRLLSRGFVMLVACAALVSLLACGGSSSSSTSPSGPVSAGTTPGLYHVLVTATSGNTTASATLPLNVQ
jgi:Abnormal spindle-like microcephaly-assoc'd, ASPM-SPD-2-Hydin/Beta-propeller repeat